MDEELKVAVITGSSTGIGYEMSLTLARNGF
jgi:short-subunit dehydrogenase